MRPSSFLRTLPLLFVVASSVLLHAQFQKPTDEELKMTADPKEPGAAAVYFNIEETADDEHHFHSAYARIKVLAEKGKEMATVAVPYQHGYSTIVAIQGRTIHADGTVIPLEVKPEDLLVAKTTAGDGYQWQVNRKVFTLPSVEVGSILEYSYQLAYDVQVGVHWYLSPHWEIQRPYFVHKAHYVFIPYKSFLPGLMNEGSHYLMDGYGRDINSLLWFSRLPSGMAVKSDSKGILSVDVTDIPPTPEEEYMPPIESVLYKVFFYYKNSGSAADFWNTDGKLWSKDVDHFAETSKAIKEAVDGLIAPGDSYLDKAKKLYKAVQALDNTDYSRKKTDSEMKQLKLKEPKHAEDIWNQKSGDSEEIALLYLAMLRAAGLNAHAMKVVDRDKRIFDSTYLAMNQFDSTLAVLNIDGKEMLLDPGEKMCPFQTVSWRHSGAGGILQSAKGTSLGTSPLQVFADNKTLHIGDITLDSHGAFTGSFRFEMIGQEALRWRQVALRNDPEEVKKQFDKSLENIFPGSVEAHVDHFTGLDDPDVKLIAFVTAKGNLGTATSKRMMLPAFFFETRGAHPFVAQEKRQTPVDMQYESLVNDQVTYHLPAGFTVEGAPPDAKIAWPLHAVFTTKSISSPGQVIIYRSLASAFTFAKPEEYNDLRGFYQKIAAADQQQLVLTTATPAN
jgi:hypothetical protein